MCFIGTLSNVQKARRNSSGCRAGVPWSARLWAFLATDFSSRGRGSGGSCRGRGREREAVAGGTAPSGGRARSAAGAPGGSGSAAAAPALVNALCFVFT